MFFAVLLHIDVSPSLCRKMLNTKRLLLHVSAGSRNVPEISGNTLYQQDFDPNTSGSQSWSSMKNETSCSELDSIMLFAGASAELFVLTFNLGFTRPPAGCVTSDENLLM